MNRIDPLIRIAQAETDILKKYFEARRIRVLYREDGCPEDWYLVQNKKGHRSPIILDGQAFQALKTIWIESSGQFPKRYDFKSCPPLSFMHDIIGASVSTSYSWRNILFVVADAFERTIEIEEETGNFVYEYEEDENESDGEPNDE